jgi:hypothetical protein
MPPASDEPEPEPDPEPPPVPSLPPEPPPVPAPPEESPLGADPPEESPDAALVEAEVEVVVLDGAESAPPVAPPGTVSLPELTFEELPPPHDARPIARAAPAKPVEAIAAMRLSSVRESFIRSRFRPCDDRRWDRCLGPSEPSAHSGHKGADSQQPKGVSTRLAQAEGQRRPAAEPRQFEGPYRTYLGLRR